MAKRLRNRLLEFLTEKEKKEGRRIRQSEIAKAINVSPSTIGGWLQQETHRVDENVLIGLCEYFGVTFDQMLYIEEVDDPPANGDQDVKRGIERGES